MQHCCRHGPGQLAALSSVFDLVSILFKRLQGLMNYCAFATSFLSVNLFSILFRHTAITKRFSTDCSQFTALYRIYMMPCTSTGTDLCCRYDSVH